MVHVRKIVDELRIVTLLKAAPQTTVFHAEDPASGRAVALKLINALGGAAGEENRERFQAEVRRLGEAGLPFFPQIMDFGFTPDGRAFLVTSLEDGKPLLQLKDGDVQEVLQRLASLAGCLAVLESLGISHGNITPTNVLVIGDNILLLGLGSVGFLGSLMRHAPEWAAFAAPELLRPDAGALEPGPKADLYSTARVAAELLGAAVDDAGGSRPVVHLPQAVRSGVADPVGLEDVLATCLRGAPTDRRISLAELAETLRTGGESAPMPDLADLGGVGPASARIAPPAPPERAKTPEALDPNATRPAMTPEELASFSVEPDPAWEATPEVSADHGAPEPPSPPPSVPPPVPEDVPPPVTPTEPPPDAGPPPTAPAPPAVETEVSRGGEGAPPAAGGGGGAAHGNAMETPAETKAQETHPAGGAPAPAPAKVPPAEKLVSAIREADPRLLLSAGLLALVVVVTAIFLVFGRGGGEAPPPPVTVEPTPPPVVVVQPEPEEQPASETPQLDPRIEAARAALEAGDTEGAAKVLAGLSAADVEGLDEQSRAAYDELQQSLRAPARDRAVRNLDRALKRGDMRLLRRTMRELDAMPRSELAGVKGLRGKMARARKAIQLHTLLWRAKKAGDDLQVIERAQALLAVVPAYTRAKTLRAEAAKAVEQRAEDAAARRDYVTAAQLLEKEKGLWPEREGLDARIETYRRMAQRNEKLEAVLHEAQSALDAGDPARGLKILGTAKPSGAYVERFDELRGRLKSALEARDAQPPRVVLEPGFKLRFKKHQTLVIPFRATDDLGVKAVVANIRRKGERVYHKVPLRHVSGDRWVLELTPELHGNATVELFVVAEDASGHKGVLGTGSRPLKVLRKRWYQK